MLRKLLPALFTLLALFAHAEDAPIYQPQEGDVVFQSMPHTPITDAIEAVTSSPFSHCGIVHQTKNDWVVIEAIGPVKETPLTEWIARGREGAYTVFRLRDAYQDKIPAFIKAAQGYEGLPYDSHYEFDDKAIYCSELIFKAFRTADGEDLGKIQTLGELKLDGQEDFIKSIESGTIPRDRQMITPRSLSEAPQLQKVYEVK